MATKHYTATEVANLYDVDSSTIRQWTVSGFIPHEAWFKVPGGHYRYRKKQIDAWMKEQNQKPDLERGKELTALERETRRILRESRKATDQQISYASQRKLDSYLYRIEYALAWAYAKLYGVLPPSRYVDPERPPGRIVQKLLNDALQALREMRIYLIQECKETTDELAKQLKEPNEEMKLFLLAFRKTAMESAKTRFVARAKASNADQWVDKAQEGIVDPERDSGVAGRKKGGKQRGGKEKGFKR